MADSWESNSSSHTGQCESTIIVEEHVSNTVKAEYPLIAAKPQLLSVAQDCLLSGHGLRPECDTNADKTVTWKNIGSEVSETVEPLTFQIFLHLFVGFCEFEGRTVSAFWWKRSLFLTKRDQRALKINIFVISNLQKKKHFFDVPEIAFFDPF